MKRFHLKVSGRVQGVGYRYFAIDTASELGLSGWARNTHDGSVEIEAQGDPLLIDKFCDQLRKGPPMARVTELELKEIKIVPSDTEFTIRH